MKVIQYDLFRISGKVDWIAFLKAFFTLPSFRFLVYFRIIAERRKINPLFWFVRIALFFLSRKMTIEIPYTVRLGKGFLMIHPYGITFNSGAVIGENFTILKGATIGNIKTGKKQGSPIIGNNVYLGLNSTIVGGVKIGNDVLIAANTYVNFDVPDGALVIGSPGVIHKKRKASEPYINNSISLLFR